MIAQVILVCAAVLSAACALVAIVTSRGRMQLDKETLDKLRREQSDKDAARNRERVAADDKRVAGLHKEIAALEVQVARGRAQWLDAISDIDELWEYIEGHVPWDREAYRELRELGSDISPPPTLSPRPRRHYGDGAPTA